jgi:uncharacterized protein DUF4240
MSDDSFADFCDWLIGQGREVYERAIADPDSLGDEPAGEEWDEENLSRLFPRLTARFGS